MEPRPLRLAVDLDDTLAQTNKRLVNLLNDDMHLNLTVEDFTQWAWWSVIEPFKTLAEKYGDDVAQNLAWRFYALAWWNPSKVELMPGAVESMHKLIADPRFMIDIVSARQLNSLRDVMIWLKSHGIQFRAFVSMDAFGPYNKVQLDYDIFVDDSPSLAKQIREHPEKTLILMDRPWNRDIITGGNVYRAHNWDEIMTVLEEIVRQVIYDL